MIKKSIFTFMLMAVIGYVSAQSLRLEMDGTIYENGQTIVCNTEEYGEFIQKFHVRNLASVDQDVVLEKEVVEPLAGVMDYFCWGNCFLPETMVTPPVPVPANSLSTDEMSMHAMFDDEVFGSILMKYSVYESRTPDDPFIIYIRFHKSGEGVEDKPAMEIGKAYPNPASSMVHFNYAFEGEVTAVVYNLLGQEVLRQELNAPQGQLTFSVDNLQDGIYFCNIICNGRTWNAVKFVVKK